LIFSRDRREIRPGADRQRRLGAGSSEDAFLGDPAAGSYGGAYGDGAEIEGAVGYLPGYNDPEDYDDEIDAPFRAVSVKLGGRNAQFGQGTRHGVNVKTGNLVFDDGESETGAVRFPALNRRFTPRAPAYRPQTSYRPVPQTSYQQTYGNQDPYASQAATAWALNNLAAEYTQQQGGGYGAPAYGSDPYADSYTEVYEEPQEEVIIEEIIEEPYYAYGVGALRGGNMVEEGRFTDAVPTGMRACPLGMRSKKDIQFPY
jgi:hypothetical protein